LWSSETEDLAKFGYRNRDESFKKINNLFIFGYPPRTCWRNLVIKILFFNIWWIRAIFFHSSCLFLWKSYFSGPKNEKNSSQILFCLVHFYFSASVFFFCVCNNVRKWEEKKGGIFCQNIFILYWKHPQLLKTKIFSIFCWPHLDSDFSLVAYFKTNLLNYLGSSKNLLPFNAKSLLLY